MGKKKKKKVQAELSIPAASTSSVITINELGELTPDFCQFLDDCRYGRAEKVHVYMTEHVEEMANSTRLQQLAFYFTLAIPFKMPLQYKETLEQEELPVAYHQGHFAIVDFLLETYPLLDLNQRFSNPALDGKDYYQFYVTSAIFYASSEMVKKLIEKGVFLDLELFDGYGLLDMVILGLDNHDFNEREEAEKILFLLLKENKKKRIFSEEELNKRFRQVVKEGFFHLMLLFLQYKIGEVKRKDFEIIGTSLIKQHTAELFSLRESKEASYSFFLEKTKKELNDLVDIIMVDHVDKIGSTEVLTELPGVLGLFLNVKKKLPSASEKHSEEARFTEIYINLLNYYMTILQTHYEALLDREFGAAASSKKPNKKSAKKKARGVASTSISSSGTLASTSEVSIPKPDSESSVIIKDEEDDQGAKNPEDEEKEKIQSLASPSSDTSSAYSDALSEVGVVYESSPEEQKGQGLEAGQIQKQLDAGSEQALADLGSETDDDFQDPLSSLENTPVHDFEQKDPSLEEIRTEKQLDVVNEQTSMDLNNEARKDFQDALSFLESAPTPHPEQEEINSDESRIRKLLNRETVKFIFQVIEEEQGSAYLTGGAVRDVFSNRESRDFDYITNLSAETLHKALQKKGCSVRFSQVMPHLLTVEHQGVHIDLVCNRPLDLYEDAMTKDFRCNALYLNKEGRLIEVLPGSIDDAKKSILTPTSSWEEILSVPEHFSKEYNHFWYLDKNPYRIMRAMEFVMRGFSIAAIDHFRLCARKVFLEQEPENAKFQIQRILKNCRNREAINLFLRHLVGCGLMDQPLMMRLCSEEVGSEVIFSAIQHSFFMPQMTYVHPNVGFFPVHSMGHPPSLAVPLKM